MPFGWRTPVGPINQELDGGHDHQMGRDNFWGCPPFDKHCEPLLECTHKRLNRSRCRFGISRGSKLGEGRKVERIQSLPWVAFCQCSSTTYYQTCDDVTYVSTGHIVWRFQTAWRKDGRPVDDVRNVPSIACYLDHSTRQLRSWHSPHTHLDILALFWPLRCTERRQRGNWDKRPSEVSIRRSSQALSSRYRYLRHTRQEMARKMLHRPCRRAASPHDKIEYAAVHVATAIRRQS